MDERRIRFQDLETICGIDLGKAFGHINHEYFRIMCSRSPQDTLVNPFIPQQEAYAPSAPTSASPPVLQKPKIWNAMPSDRSALNEIFEQVQQDQRFFEQSGVHVLAVDDPLRAEHAALCLATNHILHEYKVSVY